MRTRLNSAWSFSTSFWNLAKKRDEKYWNQNISQFNPNLWQQWRLYFNLFFSRFPPEHFRFMLHCSLSLLQAPHQNLYWWLKFRCVQFLCFCRKNIQEHIVQVVDFTSLMELWYQVASSLLASLLSCIKPVGFIIKLHQACWLHH